ncbi:MAG: chromosome segregation protein SMC [Azoarcus sp.]|jgi:chromosome segregation protein|nr:chromosome segregation protein SMC [Azoarcus sp.]
MRRFEDGIRRPVCSVPVRPILRLSKLKLAGFKTFVDPVTVRTSGDLVGIVGPNGCGKSNIIDAVRWVLGETRASALRGESMQDVIFNGSTTRKPVSRASVELVFDNAAGRAAGQWSPYAEIAVRRVLERTGESSYYINGIHVRRRDVIDLFLGTGLGPRAYAIIEQGMISRIIEARPEEIRGFLEEAAGVTRYRERRRETEGRLSDARDNLARLDDIRLELGERIGHLEAQAATAERYQTLNAALVERQQLLWLIKRNEARAGHLRAVEELNAATARIDADNARLQALESALEEARAGHLAASETVHLAQSDLFAVGAEVSRLEAELQHLGETRQRLEARLTQLDIDHEHWRARREALDAERARWEALAENAAQRAEQAEARHDEISDRLPELDAAQRAAETTVASVRRELAATEQQLRVEEANRAHADRALDALVQRRVRLDGENGEIEGPDVALLAERQARLDALRERCDALQQDLAEAQARQPALQAALKDALEAERAVQRRLTESRAQRNALVQLQAKVAAQGTPEDWLARHGHDGLPPLWRALKVEAGWETAVETVLRERLAALVTAEGGALAADLLAEPPAAALALGFADGAALPAPAMVAPPGAVPLSAHVQVADAAQRALLDDWLQGWFAVERLDGWLPRRAGLAPGVCLVSRGGQVLSRNMLAHFVPDSRTHGVIERQREIDVLTARQEALEDEALAARESLLGAEAVTAGAQARIDDLRRDGQASQGARHAEEVELLKLTQEASRAGERRARISNDLADLARQEEGERERHTRAGLEHARAAELAGLQRSQLDAAIEVLRERDEALRALRTMEQSLGRELQEAQFSARECAGKLEDNTRNLQLAGEQLDRLAEERGVREAELEATDDSRCHESLQAALEMRGVREAALAGRRDALEQAAALLRETEELRLRTEHEAAPLRSRVADLRLQAQAAELAITQFDERLVEAKADEAALAPLLADAPGETALQREVARLGREIAALGAVNLAAVEELRTAAERKGYLDAQNDDLLQAIETLEDAIRRIDRETREQLQATYNTVNEHFGRLFPLLFGGGRAALVLTGEEILDAGIQIVAQPPGKKNASIQLLSGGEKALTAIALVFAMFHLNPAPFCMLDEVDAPLDDANTGRYADMVKQMSAQTQFIFISHNRITMEVAQQLVGVTMQEQGVSRVVEVDMEAALRLAEPAAA